jgi:hypothetical protein
MANALTQVRVPAIATSMMASLYGATRTWDDTLSLTDLFGYSGHAFILNIERTLCSSGPTAWDWGAIFFPLRQMLHLKRICATCDMRDTEEARELIWVRTLESIDAGRPVVLWDVALPEFYLAHGYDEAAGAYIVQGPGDEESQVVSAARLGRRTGRVWGLFPTPHEAPNPQAARDLAVRGAVAWHRWSNERNAQWTFGGEAWQVWIDAIGEEDLPQDRSDLSENQHVYAECRRHAATFLAHQGSAYAEAAAAYHDVATALEAVRDAWPYPSPAPSFAERKGLAELLIQARDAEERGVRALESVIAQTKTARRA